MLFIVFLVLMSVGSLIGEHQIGTSSPLTLEGMVVGAFFLIMLVGVIIALLREGIGGLILTIVGLAAIVVFILTYAPGDYWVTLVIGAPFLVSGILFLMCWRRIRKSKIPQDTT